VRDAAIWREIRVGNAAWLRPWEPTNPETPLYRSSIGPYVGMARTMRREARQGLALPWVVTYAGRFAGQLTVGGIVWGSARTGQVGYWIDQAAAGRGVIPTALAMAVDHCFFVVGLHRVEASIRPENQASRRVVEKLGFREEGLRRRYLHIDGAWRDHLCYALTAEDVRGGLLTRWRSVLGSQRAARGPVPGGPDWPQSGGVSTGPQGGQSQVPGHGPNVFGQAAAASAPLPDSQDPGWAARPGRLGAWRPGPG
jgi:ribosomal-protein-alanine N-acetyltransferase